MHLTLDSKPEELATVAAKVTDAGLTLYGGGVIDMPNKAQVTRAFDYGKAAGLRVLVAEEKDPLPGLCECVGYTKGVLAAL